MYDFIPPAQLDVILDSSAVVLMLISYVCLFGFALLVIRYDHFSRYLGVIIATIIFGGYWTLNAYARLSLGYQGPSELFRILGTFKDAVIILSILAMMIVLTLHNREKDGRNE